MTNKYYGQITLAVTADSQHGLERFKSMYDADGLEAALILRTLDDKENKQM